MIFNACWAVLSPMRAAARRDTRARSRCHRTASISAVQVGFGERIGLVGAGLGRQIADQNLQRVPASAVAKIGADAQHCDCRGNLLVNHSATIEEYSGGARERETQRKHLIVLPRVDRRVPPAEPIWLECEVGQQRESGAVPPLRIGLFVGQDGEQIGQG